MNIDSKTPLVYVTRDIERALGMDPKDGYFIVANRTPYGEEVRSRFPENVWLIEDPRGQIDTYDLLMRDDVSKMLSEEKADLVVFQNTPRIERLAAERGWKLLNPSAELANRVEEKISQIAFLGEDASFLPRHTVAALKDMTYEGRRFVLQFNHSHTGQGTYIIDSKEALQTLAGKFPDRRCRAVDFIEGPIFTVNVVVSTMVLVGNTSYQITGLRPFTDLPFSTIGNDWSLPGQALDESQLAGIEKIGLAVGKRLKASGWKGLFGIDVVVESATGEVFLLEINARQPASAVFESELQRKASPGGLSTFQAHIDALKGLQEAPTLTRIAQGAQVVKRITGTPMTINTTALQERGMTLIEYKNYAPNKELLRIQSEEGIMKAHGTWNDLGDFILSCIK